jgi:hypothetical protein
MFKSLPNRRFVRLAVGVAAIGGAELTARPLAFLGEIWTGRTAVRKI